MRGKYQVIENGHVIHATRSLKDACCTAGERADATRATAALGTVIEVTHPERKDLPLYRMVELDISGRKVRDWDNK